MRFDSITTASTGSVAVKFCSTFEMILSHEVLAGKACHKIK